MSLVLGIFVFIAMLFIKCFDACMKRIKLTAIQRSELLLLRHTTDFKIFVCDSFLYFKLFSFSFFLYSSLIFDFLQSLPWRFKLSIVLFFLICIMIFLFQQLLVKELIQMLRSFIQFCSLSFKKRLRLLHFNHMSHLVLVKRILFIFVDDCSSFVSIWPRDRRRRTFWWDDCYSKLLKNQNLILKFNIAFMHSPIKNFPTQVLAGEGSGRSIILNPWVTEKLPPPEIFGRKVLVLAMKTLC